jgi:hypothetical protein
MTPEMKAHALWLARELRMLANDPGTMSPILVERLRHWANTLEEASEGASPTRAPNTAAIRREAREAALREAIGAIREHWAAGRRTSLPEVTDAIVRLMNKEPSDG